MFSINALVIEKLYSLHPEMYQWLCSLVRILSFSLDFKMYMQRNARYRPLWLQIIMGCKVFPEMEL